MLRINVADVAEGTYANRCQGHSLHRRAVTPVDRDRVLVQRAIIIEAAAQGGAAIFIDRCFGERQSLDLGLVVGHRQVDGCRG